MKRFLSLALFLLTGAAIAQNSKISTIDFVQIQNNNRAEAIYYYENNWLILRKMALKNGYIDTYELIEVEREEGVQFDLILKTTYANKEAYDLAEERFTKLIEEKGPLRLMNDKEPGDFRKIIFGSSSAKHLF